MTQKDATVPTAFNTQDLGYGKATVPTASRRREFTAFPTTPSQQSPLIPDDPWQRFQNNENTGGVDTQDSQIRAVLVASSGLSRESAPPTTETEARGRPKREIEDENVEPPKRTRSLSTHDRQHTESRKRKESPIARMMRALSPSVLADALLGYRKKDNDCEDTSLQQDSKRRTEGPVTGGIDTQDGQIRAVPVASSGLSRASVPPVANENGDNLDPQREDIPNVPSGTPWSANTHQPVTEVNDIEVRI